MRRTDLLATGGFDLRYRYLADFHSAWRVMQRGAVERVDGFDIAFFPLDGVSSDWRRAVDIYMECEAVLADIDFGLNRINWIIGYARAVAFRLKMSLKKAVG